ncbi:MAG: MarR family transcriptional regulator [Actinobacteria bacterium]|nr:MAG: MarR family transcriptional regulator [Actinomycetota bacterium]
MSRQVLSDQRSAPVEAWVRLLRGQVALRRIFDGQLQADHELTLNDFEALLTLARADGHMRRVDLAERLLLTPSGVTRLLDGLEQCGLVEKGSCPSDGRVTYAVLTEIGRDRLQEAADSHLAAVAALFEERYTPEELETLADLLGRLPSAGTADASECRP